MNICLVHRFGLRSFGFQGHQTHHLPCISEILRFADNEPITQTVYLDSLQNIVLIGSLLYHRARILTSSVPVRGQLAEAGEKDRKRWEILENPMKCNLSVRSCVFGCLGFSNTNDLAPVSLLGSCLASVHSGALLECVFLFGVCLACG